MLKPFQILNSKGKVKFLICKYKAIAQLNIPHFSEAREKKSTIKN